MKKLKNIVLQIFIILSLSIITEQYFCYVINKHTESQIQTSSKIDHQHFEDHFLVHEFVLLKQKQDNSYFEKIIHIKNYNKIYAIPKYCDLNFL